MLWVVIYLGHLDGASNALGRDLSGAYIWRISLTNNAKFIDEDPVKHERSSLLQKLVNLASSFSSYDAILHFQIIHHLFLNYNIDRSSH